MSDSFCAPCESRGINTPAHRIVREGQTGKMVPKCSWCYEKNLGVLDKPQKGPTLAQLAERALCEPARPGPDRIVGLEAPKSLDEAAKSGPRKEKRTVSKNIDWAQVQKERDGGTPVGQLAEKYSCSSALIYVNTKGTRRAAPPKASANGAKPEPQKKTPTKSLVVESIANGGIRAAIAQLEAQKQRIDTALDALRQLA